MSGTHLSLNFRPDMVVTRLQRGHQITFIIYQIGMAVLVAEYVVKENMVVSFRLRLVDEFVTVESAARSLKQDAPINLVVPRL